MTQYKPLYAHAYSVQDEVNISFMFVFVSINLLQNVSQCTGYIEILVRPYLLYQPIIID